MGIIGKTQLRSPTTGNIRNPLKGGKNTKALREQHRKVLRQSGVEEPRSPL